MKILDLLGLEEFFDNLKNFFSKIGHKHKIADLEDYTVDSSFSATSTNPVQNKVINEVLLAFANDVEKTETDISALNDEFDAHKVDTNLHVDATKQSNWNTAYTHSQNNTVHITSEERAEWNDAVSKEHTHSNKSVLDNATASYTTEEKTKLSGIEDGATNTIDWFGSGISIPSNVDLDTYTTEGKYYCSSSDTAETLTNSPTSENFVLFVFKRGSGTINQMIITLNSHLYMRGCNSSGSLREWKRKVNDSELDEIIAEIGSLTDLTTTEKSSIIGAINEVKALSTSAYNLANTANTNVNVLNDEFDDHVADTVAHMTSTQKSQLTTAYNHSQSSHLQVEDSVTSTSTTTAATPNSVKKAYDLATTANTNATQAKTAVTTHNTATDAHNDIRLLITNLTTQVNNFLDVDDTTKDELSEIIALIEANADSIESITSGKVNVSDIINNLTTNVTNKPLSAAQGVAIKSLIDALQGALDDIVDGTTTVAKATSATSATNAATSTYATKASSATKATTASKAGTATYATNSGTAVKATNADTATYAINSGTSTYATSAGSAAKATSATSAVYSSNATNASTAVNAVNADTATYAENSDTAAYAENAGTATRATNADTATYAINSGTSTYSSNSAKATSATSATRATTASKAGTATYATNSGTATYSKNSSTATTLNGLTATVSELNYVDGVTSNIQTQLDGKAPSSHNHDASNITSGTISVDRLPIASSSEPGITIVWPASQCTSFSSDNGTVTPLAVQKGAKMFAITRPSSSTDKAITRYSNTTGDVQDSKIIIEDVTNTRDTSKTAQVIAIPADGDKKMVYGYCTDQVDGTSFIGGLFDADATAYPYSEGLAIGGSSGNLLWKGAKVATVSDLSGYSTTNHTHNYAGSTSAGGAATRAINADTATYATNAGTSTKAGTATYATNSGTAAYSSNGAKATSATSATYASTATKAGTATYATNSGTAAYSSNGAKATSATSATYATTATKAGTATRATNADTATYATKATTATYLNATSAIARYYRVYDPNSNTVGQFFTNTAGTTANTGDAYVMVGNSNASSVAGNARGYVRIYDASTCYGQIRTNGAFSANRTVTIPNASGTMAYLNHLGRTNACTVANTSYGTYMARAIAAGTGALTAGSTTMTNGTIYLQYE